MTKLTAPAQMERLRYLDSRFESVRAEIARIISNIESQKDTLEATSNMRFDAIRETIRIIQMDVDVIEKSYTRETEMEKAISAALRSVDVRFKHVEDVASLMQRNIDLRFSDVDRATTLATESMDKRLEGMNEFRDQLRDQASRFVTRQELEDKILAVQNTATTNTGRVTFLENARANLEGRIWGVGALVTILSLAISIGVHFIH